MKRFTETSKWDDPWFRGLKGFEKLVFLYVIDRCNNAGFWEMDQDGMVFQTKLSEANISGAWQGLVRGLIVRDGWVWVRRFLRHQKNENLNPENNAHVQIISLVKEQVDRFSGVPEFDEFLAPYQPLFRGIGKGKVEVKVEKGSAEGKQKHPIPEPPAILLSIDGFAGCWASFVQHRKQIKKPMTGLSATRIFAQLSERPSEAVDALDMAIRRGWQGFEWGWYEKEKPKNGSSKEPPIQRIEWASDATKTLQEQLAERKAKEEAQNGTHG